MKSITMTLSISERCDLFHIHCFRVQQLGEQAGLSPLSAGGYLLCEDDEVCK